MVGRATAGMSLSVVGKEGRGLRQGELKGGTASQGYRRPNQVQFTVPCFQSYFTTAGSIKAIVFQ